MSETPGYLPIIVIRLAEPAPEGDDLRELAKRAGYRGLAALLDEQPEIEAARAIQGIGPEELLAAEQRARDSDYPPLHSLTSFWRLDCSAIPENVEELIGELSKLPEIGLAYRESETTEPAPVTNPGQNPRYASEQGYLTDAPDGIGVTHAWALVDGSGVGFADVERGWLVTHEDLAGLAPNLLSGNTMLAASLHHGAAVLGIVAGRDNTVGVIGIAPGILAPRLSTQFINNAATPNVAEAVLKTVIGPAALAPGDVLLVEVQLPPTFRPAEAESLTFTAIRVASALGIIVVEAAGNGSFDLVTQPEFDPANASFQGDSGAIMVAGAESAFPHARTLTTNFGDRVDCYAWGENVTTASGDGEVPTGALEEQRYTNMFAGTSAASAIVAGAALLVQGVYQLPTPTRPAGERLSPRRMRQLLTAIPNSTGAPAGSKIGRMPDLAQLITVVGDVPDLYIRDNVGDTGAVPSAGLVSVSPDVAVSPTSVAPSAAFAAGGSTVEIGQDNFVYVRVSNRNAVAAANAEIRVYWSEVATLITPDMWTPLNPVAVPPQPADAVVNVPANGWLVEAPEIVWDQGNLPASAGHRCFVATVDHPLDPQPNTADFDWDQFLAYIRNNNNVTWRNFEVVELPTGGNAAPADFLVAGAPDRERSFELEVLQSQPDAARVVWELPLVLFRQLKDADFAEVEIDGKLGRARALLRPCAELVLPKVLLKRSARHECRFLLTSGEVLPEAFCTLAISQRYDGIEVGRVTWELRAGRE